MAIVVVLLFATGWALLAHAKRAQQHPQGTVRKLFGFVPKTGQHLSVTNGDDKRYYKVIRDPWESPGNRIVIRGLQKGQARFNNGSAENVVIATRTQGGWQSVVELELVDGRW